MMPRNHSVLSRNDDLDFHKHTVFERDPFAVDCPPRAHYFPSPERKLKVTQRCIKARPGVDKTEKTNTSDRYSPNDELFLKHSNVYHSDSIREVNDVVDDTVFDEAWPTSEKSSDFSGLNLDNEDFPNRERQQEIIDRLTGIQKSVKFMNQVNSVTSKQSGMGRSVYSSVTDRSEKRNQAPCSRSKIPLKDHKVSAGKRYEQGKMEAQPLDKEGSVLQRYVERFRSSAPMSREQREKLKGTSSTDFWWMSKNSVGVSPSDSSLPVESDSGGNIPERISALTKDNLDRNAVLEEEKISGYRSWKSSPDHRKISEIQEKAQAVLEKSSSTVLSTDPAVSTEGLNSNASDMSSIEEYTYRPHFTKYIGKENIPHSSKTDRQYKHTPAFVHPVRPEDDLLQKWRLRRKMELAKEAGPVNKGQFDFLAKTEQQKKIDEKLEEFKLRLAGKETSINHRPRETAPNSSETPNICDTTYKRQNIETICSTSQHLEISKQHPVDFEPQFHHVYGLLPFQNEREKRDYDEMKLANKEKDYTQFLKAEKPDVEVEYSKRQSENHLHDKDDRAEFTDVYHGSKVGQNFNKTKITDEYNGTPVTAEKCFDDSKDKHDSLRDSKIFQVPEEKRERTKTVTVISSKNRVESECQKRPDEFSKSPGHRNTQRKDKIHKRTGSSERGETMEAAVGEVVKGHLFSGSTVFSSVDSLPPSSSTDMRDRDQREVNNTQESEDRYESDGEFSDDHLLQMLRKQRHLQEQKLQQIDQKLRLMDRC